MYSKGQVYVSTALYLLVVRTPLLFLRGRTVFFLGGTLELGQDGQSRSSAERLHLIRCLLARQTIKGILV